MLSFHPLLVGGDPTRTSAIYALIAHLERAHGVHFAMGGTGALVHGLVDLIEGQGRVRYNATVERILVEDDRAAGVALEGGEHIEADIVAPTTRRTRISICCRSRRSGAGLQQGQRTASSMGLFVWYFGTDRRYEDVPHHMILLGARYRALLDIFRSKHLAEDFSLYLHRPTATDPSLFEGCDAFYVLSPVPHLEGDDWNEMAERRDAIAAALEATVLPGLGDAQGSRAS